MEKAKIFAIDSYNLKLVSGDRIKCVDNKTFLGNGLIWKEIISNTINVELVDDSENNNNEN